MVKKKWELQTVFKAMAVIQKNFAMLYPERYQTSKMDIFAKYLTIQSR